MYMRLLDNDSYWGSWQWDSDSGVKGGWLNANGYLCTPGVHEWSVHMRVYADAPENGGDDRMGYSLSWGYWVVATSHWDTAECFCVEKASGWSEDAEDYLAQFVRRAFGYDNVSADWYWHGNRQCDRAEGCTIPPSAPRFEPYHIVQSNGYATMVRVPYGGPMNVRLSRTAERRGLSGSGT
jgi:hypothetical protein